MARRTERAQAAKASSTEAKAKPKKRRFSVSTLLAVLLLLAGLGIMFYPTFSNWWNSLHQSRAVMDYAQNVSNLDKDQYDKILADAEAYNARLAQTGDLWQMTEAQQQEYESLLNVDGTGIMGYIQIPKINIQLPIYHGTDDAVLQTSIGHLAGTSLPVGGEGSHSVLSGHRGLPSSRLFTDLDQLVIGDTFTLTILNETLTYQVDQILTVEPNDLSAVQIVPGQDLCTLLTCTPYGINTHRLLVRGHRIPNANGNARVLSEAIQVQPVYVAPFIAVPFAVVLVVYVFVSSRLRAREGGLEEAYLVQHGLVRPRAKIQLPTTEELDRVVRKVARRRR